MRQAARVDANQAEIVAALRQVGASVQPLHMVGRGCPDIVVGFRRANVFMEIKSPCGKLTQDEREWIRAWRGEVVIVRSPEDALRAIGAIGE